MVETIEVQKTHSLKGDVKMTRGRKAEPGTHEAREYVNSGKFDSLITSQDVSADTAKRIIKAVKVGLGIKYQRD